MNPVLTLKQYPIDGGDIEPTKYKYIKDEKGVYRLNNESLRVEEIDYKIGSIFNSSNMSLSLEVSKENFILIRFGGLIKPPINLGCSIKSGSNHLEFVFDI